MKSSNGQYSHLYDIFGYIFKDSDLLRQALTHPSLEGASNYQRLEFVGDRVLGLVIADWLFEYYPNIDEGGLASRHTNLVRRETLAEVAITMNIGPEIHMAKSTEDTGGRERATILADICEGIIGGIYMDGGYAAAQKFIKKFWKNYIGHENIGARDAKTRLQEWVQSRKIPAPTYSTKDRAGPAHEPVFTVEVKVQELGGALGKGSTKRSAEQMAAAKLLEWLEGQKQKSTN